MSNNENLAIKLSDIGAIRGYVKVTGEDFESAKRIIKALTFELIWKKLSPGMVIKDGRIRLDLQGFTGDKKHYNFQMQTGNSTLSAVLISSHLSNLVRQEEQAYLVRIVRSGFEKSLLDGRLYSIE